ncbi:Uma2 family endonuclease [Microseira wollei]|uniref:Putative restriction endonuclease domain-containing protein n=1 Tax=Microseira wollei NIES-4236 TaxID=2530354 RepID=A0AAV3X6T2_9CYAN|nr:Uma2 family endonuclease [Microseira wollei]GET36961.1 protein of unknown function DUF820 [Microseira wollei NIES-4236]
MTATRDKIWTVEEYHRMIDAGILNEDDKVELLNVRIVQMSDQTPPHAGKTQRVSDYIKELLTAQTHVRMQLPITLATSEPEPDIAVVRIDGGAYGEHHSNASEIFLLVEVSYSNLQIDLEEKALIYARANIADYWVLDVAERLAYILGNPTPEGYQSEMILPDNAVIAPLAFPEIEIPLSELFLPV